ncbi:valine--tRNA ligase, putative [Plasmodium malariae]|uniref:valine--tRNA ligase n=1 Tax=Plasmodium malariae TaxID=5858 RepID=A0A1D3PAW4_PLAMA|nr:valine--tRNA ligase, putative [Plasmodium malariae]SCN12323.1 valine--tRNA ligase, putative [Plasmodium malariae]
MKGLLTSLCIIYLCVHFSSTVFLKRKPSNRVKLLHALTTQCNSKRGEGPSVGYSISQVVKGRSQPIYKYRGGKKRKWKKQKEVENMTNNEVEIKANYRECILFFLYGTPYLTDGTSNNIMLPSRSLFFKKSYGKKKKKILLNLNETNLENKKRCTLGVMIKHHQSKSKKITNDILEAIYRIRCTRHNYLLNYNFFKKDPLHLNDDIINTILRRFTISSSFYVDPFLHLYNIDEYENIYNKELINYMYLFRKDRDRKYFEKFNSSHYSNSFILIYPPPNLSGQLHAGHYFNYIYQDILCLFNKHILSKYVIPLYGTDHGGLSAHEMFSKEFKKKDHWSKEEYISEIIKWQENLKQDILKSLQQMNIIVDEKKFYSTMDDRMQMIISRAFKILYKDNLIVKKLYPVYYCEDMNTIIPRFDLQFRKEQKDRYLLKLYIVNDMDYTRSQGLSLDSNSNSDAINRATDIGVTGTTRSVNVSGCNKIDDCNVELDRDHCVEKAGGTTDYMQHNNWRNDPRNVESSRENPNSGTVKFFGKNSYHFNYVSEREGAQREVASKGAERGGRNPPFVSIELESIHDLNRLIAVLYYSSDKEKYQNKYALIPFSNKVAVPLIFCKKKNICICLASDVDDETEDIFIPVFSIKREAYSTILRNNNRLYKVPYNENEMNGNFVYSDEEKQLLKRLEKQNDDSIINFVETKKSSSIFKCAYYKNHKCTLTLAEQWSIKYDKITQLFYENAPNENFTVIPLKYKKYFLYDYINSPEWLLNRQIPYGHPIPLYKYEQVGAPASDSAVRTTATATATTTATTTATNTATNTATTATTPTIAATESTTPSIASPTFSTEDVNGNPPTCYVYGTNVDEAYENLVDSNYFKMGIIKKEDLKQEKDVLDSWFSSSLYFLHCLHQSGINIKRLLRHKGCLVDFICTGKDILYPWILRSFILLHYFMKHDHIKEILNVSDVSSVSSVGSESSVGSAEVRERSSGPPPQGYRLSNVIKFHGMLKDNVGKKISKSDENSTYYNKYLENVNVDCLRMCFSFLQKGTEDIIFSDNCIRKSKKFVRKIWNIANFIKKNCSFYLYNNMRNYFLDNNKKIYDFLKEKSICKISNIGIFNLYCNTINSVVHEMKNHNLQKSINIIHNYIMTYFSKFYLNYYAYNDDNNEINTFLIFFIFNGLLKVLYPFIPHIAEILFIQLNLKYEQVRSKEKKKKFLSCNYDFFKNQNFINVNKNNTEEKYFVQFTQIVNFLRNYKKNGAYNHKSVHIYLKTSGQQIPMEYFKNEEACLHNLFGSNVYFVHDKEALSHPEVRLNKEKERSHKLKGKQILCSSDFFIMLS